MTLAFLIVLLYYIHILPIETNISRNYLVNFYLHSLILAEVSAFGFKQSNLKYSLSRPFSTPYCNPLLDIGLSLFVRQNEILLRGFGLPTQLA